jgi:DegV family protein with EDD domain
MAGVAVVTDSTSSLGREQAITAGVVIIPLQVVIDEVSRAEAADSVTPALVARALREGKQVTTSRPTPEAFSIAFAELADAGYDAIVSAHLSKAMSGTCEAAAIAAESASVPVTVVDSCTLAMATGFAALSGAAAARAGGTAAEVTEVVRWRAAAATTYFYVDSLEYLRRGGRIGAAAALLGSALSVKPLLTVTNGEIRPYERVRTASKALVRLEELGVAALARAAGTCDHVDVAVHHLDNAAGAERLVERLRGRVSSLADIGVSEVSAVLAAHVGPGTLGIVVSPRPMI